MGALTTYPYKLRPKHFFSALWVHVPHWLRLFELGTTHTRLNSALTHNMSTLFVQ